MKKITNFNIKTKRGNQTHIRYNKLAQGMTKTYDDQRKRKHPLEILDEKGMLFFRFGNPHEYTGKINDDASTLSVYGTLDDLRGANTYLMSRRTVSHPTDAGYTKVVFYLNEMGRKKLQRMRRQKLISQTT